MRFNLINYSKFTQTVVCQINGQHTTVQLTPGAKSVVEAEALITTPQELHEKQVASIGIQPSAKAPSTPTVANVSQAPKVAEVPVEVNSVTPVFKSK